MNKKTRKIKRAASDGETGDAAIAAPSSSIAAPSSLIPRPSMLPLVIVNPASAGGATGRAWPRLASDLSTHFGAFNSAFTEKAGDARLIAEREAKSGRRLLIACGGDGTISEVANGILESGVEDSELGILPSGTGGDFRRTLNVPTRAADAAAALRTGRSISVDVGRVEFQNHAGARERRYFLNVASCGMGGEVIRRVEENSSGWLHSASRRIGGQLSYALASLQTTVAFTNRTLRIQLDDRPEFRLVVANLCIANARYFGGGMKIAPEAKPNDGLLDVVAVGDLSTVEILTNVYKLYLGTHLGMQKVQHALARRISVSASNADDEVLIEIDGELSGRLPATFEILPRRLRVRCP
ncbi:MAG TPA: diacylglycerol kinase family protein [Pyrinomonadaceae bacterium]|nr:diacylglycerol kinase family protein [Pyrinomonadaceae bacterium]